MSYHSPTQFLYLLSLIKDSHLDGIRQVRSLNLSVNSLKYAVAATACAYARMLAEDEEKRSEFYDESFWDYQQRFHRSKDLLHVLMYIENAKVGGNYKLASAHSIALQTLCDDDSVKDEDLAQHIKDNGGFSGLIVEDDSEEESHETTGALATDDADEDDAVPRRGTSRSVFTEQHDLIDDEEEEKGSPEGADEPISRPVRKTAKPAPSLTRLPRPYIERCILGRPAGEADREAILSPLRGGKSVWVKFVPGQVSDRHELYEGGGGFIDIIIEDFEVEA